MNGINIKKLLYFTLFTYTSIIFCNDLSIGTFNIRNYGLETPYTPRTNDQKLISILKKLKFDLLAIQEIVKTDEFSKRVINDLSNYKHTLSQCGGTTNQKLGFIYDPNILKLKKVEELLDTSTNSTCTVGSRPFFIGHFYHIEQKKSYIFINIHLKAGASLRSIKIRRKQHNSLVKLIKLYKEKNKYVFILGDFNSVDLTTSKESEEYFDKFLSQNKLFDFSSKINCSSYWWGGINDGIYTSSLLDHILVTNSLEGDINSYDIETKTHCALNKCSDVSLEYIGKTFHAVSDHCPVISKIDFN